MHSKIILEKIKRRSYLWIHIRGKLNHHYKSQANNYEENGGKYHVKIF